MEQVMRLAHTTSDQLAAIIGLTPPQVSELLTGYQFPSRHVTERFARACGADPLVLLKIWDDEWNRRRQSLP